MGQNSETTDRRDGAASRRDMHADLEIRCRSDTQFHLGSRPRTLCVGPIDLLASLCFPCFRVVQGLMEAVREKSVERRRLTAS
jgi:hypothetical protein